MLADNLLTAHRLVWMALLAALVAAGAWIAIPIGPIPITLQTMFIMLTGLILGPRYAALTILLYLTAGFLGLPIFSGGKGGLATLFGPSGGFLAGFLPAAILAGFAGRLSFALAQMSILTIAIFLDLALGSLQMMRVLEISPGTALAAGFLPFLPGDILKGAAALMIFRFLDARQMLPVRQC